MQELKDLKESLDGLISKLTLVSEASARSETRAQAAWDLVREHISVIAAEAGVSVTDLKTAVFQVSCLYSASAVQLILKLNLVVRMYCVHNWYWVFCAFRVYMTGTLCFRWANGSVIVQDDILSLAAAAASALQTQLTAAEDAADSQPADALKACTALRAALTRHATELQRWAVSLQVESVRQSSAAKKLAEREEAAAELQALEATLDAQKATVQREKIDLVAQQVRCGLPFSSDF